MPHIFNLFSYSELVGGVSEPLSFKFSIEIHCGIAFSLSTHIFKLAFAFNISNNIKISIIVFLYTKIKVIDTKVQLAGLPRLMNHNIH